MLLFYPKFQSSFEYIPSSFALNCLNSAHSHELILFGATFIQVFMSTKLHFSDGLLWMGSQDIFSGGGGRGLGLWKRGAALVLYDWPHWR